MSKSWREQRKSLVLNVVASARIPLSTYRIARDAGLDFVRVKKILIELKEDGKVIVSEIENKNYWEAKT